MIKLGDFGIARVLKHTMECAKTVVGTPYYLSPEICENKPYNHKSDVWSAGCILYELCVQKHAFEANSITALVRKILRGQYDDIPSIYSNDTRTLINAMLQQKPSARPAFLTILQQPFLQPYIQSFTRRCAAKGCTVPYADQLLQLIASNNANNTNTSSSSNSGPPPLVPLTVPSTRAILQQNSHYSSSSSSNQTPSNTPSNTPKASVVPNSEKMVVNANNNNNINKTPILSTNVKVTPTLNVPDEGSPVRQVVLPKGKDGIVNNSNNVRPPVVAIRPGGNGVIQHNSGIPLAPNRNSRNTIPEEDNINNNNNINYQPSKYQANNNRSNQISTPRMVPIVESEPKNNNIQVRQSIHPSNPSQPIRPVPSALPIPNPNIGNNNNNHHRAFIHDGRAYPLPVSVSKASVPIVTTTTSNSNGDPKWSATPAINITEEKIENKKVQKFERYESKEDYNTPTNNRQIDSKTNLKVQNSLSTASVPDSNEPKDTNNKNNLPRYRSSILSDPLFQAPIINQGQNKEISSASSNPPKESKTSIQSVSRDTKSVSRNETDTIDITTASKHNNNPSLPSNKGRIARYSTATSRDSDASLSNEDLLAEADELLPYGLPLDAYKINNTPMGMNSKNPGNGIKKGMRIGAVTNDTPDNSIGESKEQDSTITIPTTLAFTLVPAHLTRRKVAGRGTIFPSGINKDKHTSSSSSSSTANEVGTENNLQSPTPNPDKLLLNGNTLKLPGVNNITKDSLTYRIECLRVFLSSIMGDEAFMKLYRSLTEGRGMNISVDLSKTVRTALGKERKGLLPLVFQLIYFEEQAYFGKEGHSEN